jgi:hypothetical protein
MPEILEIKLKAAGKYTVRVRADGSAAASGKLLAADDDQGTGAVEVGTWTSPQDQDGSGEATTQPGKWLFATQLVRSKGASVPGF